MSIRTMRSRSNHTMGSATGTLVIRFPWEPSRGDVAHVTTEFEEGIDKMNVLRRQGPVEAQHGDAVIELKGAVEYGPVFGCHPSDLHRQLQAICQKLSFTVDEFDVLNY